MPTYVYKREDGTTFEIEQRITADPLTTCPTTGQPVKRVITGGTGLIFKGSGFYLTDYARSNGSNGAKQEGGDAKSDSSKGEAASTSKADSSDTKSSSSDSSASSKNDSKAA